MPKKEENYDKVLLGLAALAAIGVCAYLFVVKGDFGSQFQTKAVKKGEDFGLAPVEDVKNTITRLLEAVKWESPILNNKQVPLNKSILIILKDNELHDMFIEEKLLREPMSNAYLRTNQLDYLAPNVGDLDPDGDGFSNLEEFLAKTNPKDGNLTDPKAVPPLRNKIYFVSREQDDYRLILNSTSLPLAIKRLAPEPQKTVFVQSLPQDISFDGPASGAARFQAKSLLPKKVPDPRLGEKDVSELTLLDRATNAEVKLIAKEETNLATYKAKLQFRWKTVQERIVKKGESFTLQGVAKVFRLEDVTETGAMLAEQNADGSWSEPWAVNPQ